MVYPALLPLMRTPRLPVVDWTDAPADLNGLVRFAERRNLASARVPSRFNWPQPFSPLSRVIGRVTEVFAWFCDVCPGHWWNTSHVPCGLPANHVTSGRDGCLYAYFVQIIRKYGPVLETVRCHMISILQYCNVCAYQRSLYFIILAL
jgi:hypothetical protein